jgi:hypothetical protein
MLISPSLPTKNFAGRLPNAKKKNGEKRERYWLIYSMNMDTMFCYCCRFLSPAKHNLCKDVFRAWKYNHKTSECHDGISVRKECMAELKELEMD